MRTAWRCPQLRLGDALAGLGGALGERIGLLRVRGGLLAVFWDLGVRYASFTCPGRLA